jgi:hypothetical protein
MLHGEIEREDGERLLRLYGLIVRPASATEIYQREQRRRERGTLF